MWPPAVEDVAAVFRAAGTEARLEELAAGERSFPGPFVRAEAVHCDGRVVVALVPADRETDADRLAAAAHCRTVSAARLPPFPYRDAKVLIERLLLGEQIVWIEAGTPRHAAVLSPSQLARVVQAEPADLLAEG